MKTADYIAAIKYDKNHRKVFKYSKQYSVLLEDNVDVLKFKIPADLTPANFSRL